MRKLAIALCMVALASSAAFAKAPIINGVPDLVIGEREDSLTIDNNWFRYVDAFNILDYVTDVDSPDSDLLFTFFETTTTDDIGIRIDAAGATARTVTQVNPADATRPVNWGPNEITNLSQPANRDYLLSFVDLVRSPEPYGNTPYPEPAYAPGTDMPWHNTEGSGTLSGTSRLMWLYVADDELADGADRVTSDAMNVISRNFAFDSLSGGITSVFGSNFMSGAGTTGDGTYWASVGVTPGGWTLAAYSQAAGTPPDVNGYLTMTAGVTANTVFGRWETKKYPDPYGVAGAIPYVTPGPGESLIYCARFTMSQNQAVRGVAPQIRFGVYEGGFLTSVGSVIKAVPNLGANDAAGNPQIPGAGLLQTYKTVWSAMENTDDFAALQYAGPPAEDLRAYNAFFDMLDQYNDQGGTWTLYNLDVVTSPRPADVTPAVTFPDMTTVGGWTIDLSGGTAITITQTGGNVTFNDGGSTYASALAYYLWKRDLAKAVVNWTDNQLLRFKLELACPSATARQQFHQFRFRYSTLGYNIGGGWAIEGDDGGLDVLGGSPYIPTATGTDIYEIYVPSQVEDPSFDWTIINGANYDTITIALDAIASKRLPGDTAPRTHQLPTAVTAHSVEVEILADSL